MFKLNLDLYQWKHGLILHDQHDGCMSAPHRYGEYSPYELDLMESLIDNESVVVDVGAHMGGHAIPLARQCRALICYEANPVRRAILRANMALNALENVQVRERCSGLDELLEEVERVSFVKLDVDGPECEILENSRKLFERDSPVLYCENDRRGDAKKIIECVESLGYRCWWHIVPLTREPNFFGEPIAESDRGVVTAMMLCLPAAFEVEGLKSATAESVERIFMEPQGSEVGRYDMSYFNE